MMKQINKLFLCLFLLCSIFVPVHANDRGFYIANDETGIPDAALYEFIKMQTNKSDVYSNDLVGITELMLSDRVYSIRSLKGLSKMNLANLHSLTLDISTLTSLEDILDLTMLQTLRITNSSLTNLPDNIHLLSNLHTFELNNSFISTLPDNFFNMSSLNSLTLNAVPLSELSKDIEKLQFLDEIVLMNMSIEIPEEIFSLLHLKKIRFSGMQLSKLSSKIGDLNHLEELRLDNNAFTEIPEVIYSIPTLQVLSFQGNQLSKVSEKIEKLSNLRELDLSYNQLETLPIQLTNLSKLKVLSIHDNQISCLPSDFELLKLEGIFDFFQYNEIQKCEGTIPEVVSTTKLSFENKDLANGGYTNQEVVVLSNNYVYFMVDNVTDTELSNRKVVSNEGKHIVSAVEEGHGIADTVSFTIDMVAPKIVIQNNDMQSNEFTYDVAIESNEEGYFVVNGQRRGSQEKMLIVSDNGDYEIYQVDLAGNKSNILSFYIENEENVTVENSKDTSWIWYALFTVVVGFLAWGTYVFLHQGAKNDYN